MRRMATFCCHDFMPGSGVHRGVEAYLTGERPARYEPVHAPHNFNFCLRSCVATTGRNSVLDVADDAQSSPVFRVPECASGGEPKTRALCDSDT